MSRKHFSWLLVVTVIVAAVVLLLPKRTGDESGFARTTFMPDLQARVNELSWLQVRNGDGEVATLQRRDDHWQIEEFHGYRADWARLRALLADLAQAEIVEPKTDNPEFYARLGVEAVDSPDASGVLIQFAPDSGLPAVIVGKSAQRRDGRYVRLADQARSALIDRNLDLPQSASEWLETDIVDVSDSEVVEIDIAHADGERVVARKASADDEHFALQDIPEGREIRSAWTVDSLANGLSALALEDVAPVGEIAWDDAVRYGLVTADGLRLDVSLVERDTPSEAVEAGEASASESPEHWIRLEAGLYQTALDSAVEAPEGEGGADEADEETTDPATRAAEINGRVAGWAYRIPKYKYDGMAKRMEDLLQAVEEES
jgi:hypothetical protein